MEASVLLDMEQRALKNLTLAVYRSIMEEPEFRGYPHSGIAVQAYLRDSETDLRELIVWTEKTDQTVTVRLVKGAYWDAEVIWARQNRWPVPVFTQKHETDANFEKLVRLLLENHKRIRLACGSHNVRSIAFTMETARDLDVPEESLEYQILYGMAEPVRNALRKIGLPLRLYAPIGEMIPGMAYLVRRLLENTSNESFLRQSFSEGVDPAELLRNPEDFPSPPSDEKAVETEFSNEPPLDWTLEVHRNEFRSAMGRLSARFPLEVPLQIGGKPEHTENRFDTTSPAHPDRIVGRISSADQSLSEQALQAAVAAFPAWRDTPPRDRAEILFRAADAARKRRYDLAALQVHEVGKTWGEADADVCEAIDFMQYYGREMIRLSEPQRMGRIPGEISHLFYEPRGWAS